MATRWPYFTSPDYDAVRGILLTSLHWQNISTTPFWHQISFANMDIHYADMIFLWPGYYTDMAFLQHGIVSWNRSDSVQDISPTPFHWHTCFTNADIALTWTLHPYHISPTWYCLPELLIQQSTVYMFFKGPFLKNIYLKKNVQRKICYNTLI